MMILDKAFASKKGVSRYFMNEFKIVKFVDNSFEIDVRADINNETVWLSQEEMALLFDVDRTRIVRHINNIYKDKELDVASTCAENAQVQIEGNRKVNRTIKIYNLDMIISVGYRVKSQQGITFRKWATNVLKDYMLKGYAVNQKRLEYLEKTIKLIDIANRIDERLEENDAKEILKVIGGYSKALDLLDDYDHRTLKKIEGNVDDRKIEYKECINIINKLKFNEESSLFAVERNRGLESIIGNIYQIHAEIEDKFKFIEESM